ncbi:MAG TPA: protoporphyrinogen oxidase [Acidimicrobiia bacterium]|nr:protoporphyrinogen oxidase [Acidimicrobiia bacterium]
MRADAVVVGGGISGLVAARRLKSAGADVRLIEKSARLGGVVVTDHDDGFLVEGGPDSFVAGKAHVLELAEELGLADEVIPVGPDAGGAYVWWQGGLHPLPGGFLLMVPSRLGPLLGSSLLSWRGKARVLADLVLPRQATGGDDESLESFVTRRLGREALDRIAEPLVAGIHAAEPATMSVRASFPRFLEMERKHRSLILAARAAARVGARSGLSHFASLRQGMGRLITALSDGLEPQEIRTGVAVTSVAENGDGGYRVTSSDGNDIRARAVILATPSRVTSTLLSGMEPEAARLIGGIEQVATAAVTLAYRTGELPALSGTGFVVPAAARRRVIGVSYLSRKWGGRVPDPSFTLLRVFVGGPGGQVLARAAQDRVRAVAIEELETLVGIAARPVRSWAHVWEDGLHKYTVGHLDRVARVESMLAARPGLALAGAALYGVGLNECIASGRRAAESVSASVLGNPAATPSASGAGD